MNKQWGKCGRWSSRGAGRLSRGVQQSLENEGKSVRERWRGGIKAGGNKQKRRGKTGSVDPSVNIEPVHERVRGHQGEFDNDKNLREGRTRKVSSVSFINRPCP